MYCLYFRRILRIKILQNNWNSNKKDNTENGEKEKKKQKKKYKGEATRPQPSSHSPPAQPIIQPTEGPA
jgi:hypothetical protein